MGVLAPVSICNFCAASFPNRNSRRKPRASSLHRLVRVAVRRELPTGKYKSPKV
jgi:hypothetical protein